MSPARSVRRLRVTTLAAIAMIAGAALPAVATAVCDPTPTSQVFAPWGDWSDYSLLPEGDFEGHNGGWNLGNAWVGDENEPWKVGSPDDHHSLSLGANGYAASPWFCLGEQHPTFRFFARRDSWNAQLSYSVRWINVDGDVEEMRLGSVSRGFRSWRATNQLPLAQALNLWEAGHTVDAQLVFRSVTGSWVIDDVYVDPYTRG